MLDKINNNTIGLVIVGAIGIIALFQGQAEIGLAVVSGVVGFITGGAVENNK